MNVLQDPSKRATIHSLLNPTQVSPSFQSHLPPLAPQSSHGQDEPAGPYASQHPNTYSLKAANWEGLPNEESGKSAALSPSRQYQHQPGAQIPSPSPSSVVHNYNSPNSHQSRMVGKPRPDDYNSASWTPHQQHPTPAISNIPYGANVLPPIYSDERTAIPNDFASQSNYNSSYNEQNRSHEGAQSSWQSSERVSIRLATRNYSPERQDTANNEERYPAPLYYQQSSMYETPHQYPQQLSLLPANEDSQTQTKTTKRPHSDGDDAQAPKPKRPKAKSSKNSSTPSTSAAGSSKRGYNSRKRNEAAMISAQNAEALQRAQQEENQSGANGEQGSSSDAPKTMIPELQFARCMSNRYRNEDFPRCVSCTRRWAGDTCRFQGIRFFMRDSQRKLMGVSFNRHHGRPEGPRIEFPTQWNRAFTASHAKRIKTSIAKALLPTLEAEKHHLNLSDVVRRQREVDCRATCDTCMTSLFSSSWMCRVCGREVCQDCFKQVQELTIEPPGLSGPQKMNWMQRREKHSHANPFFLGCTKRVEHIATSFTPVTRFLAAELDKAMGEMELVIKATEAEEQVHNQNKGKENQLRSPGDGPTSPVNVATPSQARSDVYGLHSIYENHSRLQESVSYQSPQTGPSATVPDLSARCLVQTFPDPLTNPTYDDFIPAHTPSHISDIPVHQLLVIPADYYDPPPKNLSGPSSAIPISEPSFFELWNKGLPILVKNLRSRFKLRWTPEHFIDQYGEQSCLISECQNDTNKRVTIREFFAEFGNYEGRTECWKLKDWPPTSDFKTVYPDLYADFSTAVPVPDYVRRDGVYNLGSHFPVNAVGPDLGPKMYNSFASSQEPGSKGSTRLHMDMADALNVMLHAAPCKDGSEGYAAWDLYKAEDSDKIRAFLRKKYASPAAATRPQTNDGLQKQITLAHDPIHGQQFYLDSQLRRELWELYGVKSYRVYQRPGDGVFIPAGCAHQVANMSDCMKIATDFVSPENIDRCEKLTKEFREQNQAKAWKEDVLQLRTMMWFAWLSCTAKEDEFKKEEALRMAGHGHTQSNSGDNRNGGLRIGHDIAGVRVIERRS